MELRCDFKMFGEIGPGWIEVKCNSKFHGAGPGVVVLHRFDSNTGELIETNRFKDPRRNK